MTANFVHHVWMMDVTEFKTFFAARTLYFATVFDAFSRLPLTAMTFASKPGGAAMARLFRHAVAAFGSPKYVLTDLGGEFIARVFTQTVARFGVRQRFAAADNIRATARLERFWKTVKHLAHIRLLPPLNLADLEERLRHALAYYAIHRPHQGLANQTPLLAFLGAPPRPVLSLPRGPKRGGLSFASSADRFRAGSRRRLRHPGARRLVARVAKRPGPRCAGRVGVVRPTVASAPEPALKGRRDADGFSRPQACSRSFKLPFPGYPMP